MKFYVTKTSDWKYEEVIELNTLEELLEFVNKNGEIILDKNWLFKTTKEQIPDATEISREAPFEIEIYDTYRE